MKVIRTPLEGLVIIEPKVWRDSRGYFYESYNRNFFVEAGVDCEFVQDNQSLSQRGTLRGLHAQDTPFAQGKLVRVITGKVLDIAVDIRKDSPTFGKSLSIILDGENNLMLWIPVGFLHGFATLEDNTIFSYKVSNFYNQASEIGVRWNDPILNINWQLSEDEVILSEKDKQLPFLHDFSSPF